MEYIQITIPVTDTPTRELLIAQLAENDYEGFEETETVLHAFIDKTLFDEAQAKEIVSELNLTFSAQTIAQQNWNAQWEENFQPVIVSDFCTVRADFHKMEIATPYEIIITPKMSFGTGHHATTQLMINQMSKLDFKDKSVLDFGTGTGILAILATMLGAKDILAIDNDEWSVENAIENAGRNDAEQIQIKQGSLELAAGNTFDIILANINRNILLQYMAQLSTSLDPQGQILMSGLLPEDKDVIITAANAERFELLHAEVLNNWLVLLFKKKNF